MGGVLSSDLLMTNDMAPGGTITEAVSGEHAVSPAEVPQQQPESDRPAAANQTMADSSASSSSSSDSGSTGPSNKATNQDQVCPSNKAPSQDQVFPSNKAPGQDQGVEHLLTQYKHILAWQNPVRTSAVLLFLVVFTCTKFTQPIWSAMLRGTLIMLLACATAKIASIKFDRANDFLDVFARFRGSHLEELVSRANKCQMCMMKSILDVLTMQNPIKAAVWATALFITLQMVTETLLLVVTLVMILFLFAMYPVSKRLGIDAEPMLKQCVKTLSGAMCSLSRSVGLAAGGAANAKKD